MLACNHIDNIIKHQRGIINITPVRRERGCILPFAERAIRINLCHLHRIRIPHSINVAADYVKIIPKHNCHCHLPSRSKRRCGFKLDFLSAGNLHNTQKKN